MTRLIVPKSELKDILRERRRSGVDRYDEVWDGVYVMAPPPDPEHQGLASLLIAAFVQVLGVSHRNQVQFDTAVSDREEGWRKNYRSPDVAVFLPGNPAKLCQAHWMGGPDFAVEILSPGDRSREKFAFYAQVGVRELLIVDRDPWQLELYRLHEGELHLVGKSSVERPAVLTSAVLPLTFQFLATVGDPRIEMTSADGTTRWLA